jgi:putative hydrolase of the HAD superfamily
VSIRAILFDLDNTLLLEDEATEVALRQTSEHAARRAGIDARLVETAAREAAESLFGAAPVFAYSEAMGIWWGEALWGDFAGEGSDLAALRAFVPPFRREVWTRALAAAGADDPQLADELTLSYPTLRRAIRALDPEAEATLEDLGRDHELALVTNGAPDVQREKLARSGLGGHFAAIVISGEVGAGKPDPRIFRAALDLLGVASADAIMVGDSLERDVAGARRAGIRSIWLDRADDGVSPEAVGPDARIRTLGDVRAAATGLESVDPVSIARPA